MKPGRKGKVKFNASQNSESALKRFCRVTTDEIRKECPGLPLTALNREVRRRWNSLNEVERIQFGDTSAQRKERKKQRKERKKLRKKTIGRSSEFKVPISEGRRGKNSETRKALLRLQRLRIGGTWAMCSITSCSKWRYLKDVKDPSEVPELFTCRDCPEPRYGSCEAPEEEWDTEHENHAVETRFTVGSLVWAKMDGFPAWPAMVDDDPDTGEFFWTKMDGDVWQSRPSSYHVIFFDEKVVRKWIPCSRLSKFDQTKPKIPGTVLGSKLLKAFNQAMEAAGEALEERRRRHCFAQRYQGQWGPVWEECRERRMGLHLDVRDRKTSRKVLSPRNNYVPDKDKSKGKSVMIPPKPVARRSKPVIEISDHLSDPVDQKEKAKNVAKKSKPFPEKNIIIAKKSKPVVRKQKTKKSGSEVNLVKHDGEMQGLEDTLARVISEAVQQTFLFTPSDRVGFIPSGLI